MTAAPLTVCALPNCEVPVVTPGDVCDGCRAAFGPLLRPADSDADPDVIAAELAARDACVRAAYTAQRTGRAPEPACTCGHPWHDGPCEYTRDGQPDDGWTPMCDCRHPEPEHDQ